MQRVVMQLSSLIDNRVDSLDLTPETALDAVFVHRGNTARAPWSSDPRFGIFHHPAGALCNYNSGQTARGIPQIIANPTRVQEQNFHGVEFFNFQC